MFRNQINQVFIANRVAQRIFQQFADTRGPVVRSLSRFSLASISRRSERTVNQLINDRFKPYNTHARQRPNFPRSPTLGTPSLRANFSNAMRPIAAATTTTARLRVRHSCQLIGAKRSPRVFYTRRRRSPPSARFLTDYKTYEFREQRARRVTGASTSVVPGL